MGSDDYDLMLFFKYLLGANIFHIISFWLARLVFEEWRPKILYAPLCQVTAKTCAYITDSLVNLVDELFKPFSATGKVSKQLLEALLHTRWTYCTT
jgi:hypothetical protein